MNERTYTAPSNDYKYGFNGQEKDDEVSGEGNSYTAEFWQYDPRLGRRFNVDPVVKLSFSVYSTFRDNPIIFIDPQGNTDYYNTDGIWIGSNGVTDGDKKMVNSSDVVKAITKASKKGNVYVTEIPNASLTELPSKTVATAIVNTYSASLLPTPTDIEGGRHETATFINADGKSSGILHGTDILDENDVQNKYVVVHVEGPIVPKDFQSGQVSIHTHPTNIPETINDGVANKQYVFSDAGKPSANDLNTFKGFTTNIIIGKSGEIKSEKVSDFQRDASGNIISSYTYTKIVDNRGDERAFFYNSNSEPIKSIKIRALKNIFSNEGAGSKSDNKIWKKLEKKSEKKNKKKENKK